MLGSIKKRTGKCVPEEHPLGKACPLLRKELIVSKLRLTRLYDKGEAKEGRQHAQRLPALKRN